MTTFFFLTTWLFAAALAVLVFLYLKLRGTHQATLEAHQAETESLKAEAEQKYDRLKGKAESALNDMKSRLSRYQGLVNTEAEAERILADAGAEAERITLESKEKKREAQRMFEVASMTKAAAEGQAQEIIAAGRAEEKHLKKQAIEIVERANSRAASIVEQANQDAKRISENVYDLMRDTDRYQKALIALKNEVNGYGNEYVVPIQSVIDELADETAYRQAGQELKVARAHTKNMVKAGMAADCDYSEKVRRETAINFVTDAFNGKVDSILTTVKSKNVGKVEQAVRDAFALVNLNGAAFRNARITEGYLAARLEEVKWAALAQDVKKNQQEEQRRIREEAREEQRAEKERLKALKEQERERVLRDKLRAEFEQASEAERSVLQAKLDEAEERYRLAEERGQRAMSMAQQTKKGTVYVISNVGSFGEGVVKIGLTRRLVPEDRVKELGDASVPFGFDIHALIEADDAPALEHSLHNHFAMARLNKANHRKEFFRSDLAMVRSEVEKLGIEATWTMAAEAQEFRETQAIEARIESDPVARESWLNRQLVLEMDESSGSNGESDDNGDDED